MSFTFEDAEGACRRLRDRGGADTCKLADLLATCVDVGSRIEGLDHAMDAQIDEEVLSREILDSVLGDLAEAIAFVLNKVGDLAYYLPLSDIEADTEAEEEL